MAVLKPANRAANLFFRGSNHDPAPRQAHQFIVTFSMYQISVPEHLRPLYQELNQFRDRLHFIVKKEQTRQSELKKTICHKIVTILG